MSIATIVNGHWVNEMSPFLGPHWGNFGIRYYGAAYLLGFVVGAWLLYIYAKAGRSLLPADKIMDFMVYIVIGVMIGGRLGSYFLYDGWRTFGDDPLGVFKVWQGGMASHGGMIGVVVALLWFARNQRIPFLHLGDLIVSVTPAGLFFGRIANFINGELWGKISTVSWAMIFPRSAPSGTLLAQIPPRHPSQLYEAMLEGLFLFVLLQWCFWKTSWVRLHPGRIGGAFLFSYAIVRIIGEVFREPDASLIFETISRGTFYSIFMIIAGLFLILRKSTPLSFSVQNPASKK